MGKLNFSKFLVVDLEGTCWEDLARAEQLLKTETIEIGITEIDLIKREITKSVSYLVKPKDTNLSQFCTDLTTITKEQVLQAHDLTKVSKQIRTDFPYFKSTPWGAWGDDNIVLSQECNKKNAVMPFSETYYNIQELYSLQRGLQEKTTVTKALDYYKLEFEGQIHRGKDDSFNTAKILLKMWS